MSDKKARADFLKCMGMRKKERVSLLKRELYYFLLAAGADNDSRDQYLYSSNVSCSDVYACRQNCMAETCCLDMAYVSGSTVGFAWILGRFIIRKVEGKR